MKQVKDTAHRKFRLTNDREELQFYIFSKKRFKVKKEQYLSQQRKILFESRSNPNRFWELLKGQIKKRTPNFFIGVTEWRNHFKNLLYDENVGNATNGSLISDETITDNTLDAPIQGEEIIFSDDKQNSGKNPGPDGMGVEFYKSIKHRIAPTITQIFNIILNKGVIPASWTDSIICPVHKSGSLNDPSNYRGISLLNTMYKIMSSILTRRLYSWAEENNNSMKVKQDFEGDTLQ